MRKKLFHSFVSLSVLWSAICLHDVVDASNRNSKASSTKGDLIANAKKNIRTPQQQALLRSARQAVKTEEPANTVVAYMRDHKISSSTLFAIEKDLPAGFKIIREKKNGKDSIRLTYVQHDELHAQDRSSSSFSSTKETGTDSDRTSHGKQTDRYDLNSTLRLQDMQNLVRIVLNDTNGMRSDLIMIVDQIKNMYSEVNSLRADISQIKNKLDVIAELKARFKKVSEDLSYHKSNKDIMQKLGALDSKIANVANKIDDTHNKLSSFVINSNHDTSADYVESDTEHSVDETLEHKETAEYHSAELDEHVDRREHIESVEHEIENSEQSEQESSSVHTEEERKKDVADHGDVDNEEKASDAKQHDSEVSEEGNAKIETSTDEDIKEHENASEDAQKHVDKTEPSVKSEGSDEHTNDSVNDAPNSNNEDAAYKKFIERRQQEREVELKKMQGNKIVKSMAKDYGALKNTSSETDNGINKKSSDTSEYNERKMKNDPDAAYKEFIKRRQDERNDELKKMQGNKIVKSMTKDYGELKDTSSETDNGINKKNSNTSEYNERKMKDAAGNSLVA